MEKKADLLMEISWEVCNKVGGIYTVVRSKAARMVENYGNGYYLIGPYFSSKAFGEFIEEIPNDFCRPAFEELKRMGILCHFGKWQIEGSPNVILVDFENYRGKINDMKKELWEHFGIDSLKAPADYDEPVAWAYTVGILLEKIHNSHKEKKMAAQFHEWLSGAGILYLKSRKIKIATVFTTHATALGRTLSGWNVDIYNVWEKIDPEKEAYSHNIESKHMVEKSSAINADVFTTVSEITGMEASHFLKKKPDFLLPNGLDISKFPSFEELVIKHRIQRDRIREFLIYFFFPHYAFDLNESLIFFTAARYEFHDKGIDVFIKSLGRLNEKLKHEKSKKSIVAFIWVPANYRSITSELLENKTLYQDIKDGLEETGDDVKKNIIYSLVSHHKISAESLFEDSFLDEIKVRISKFVKKGKPMISTHELYDDNDQIINAIKQAKLSNSEEDPVKIIYYPIYLSGADGLLNLNYYEAMQGSHLGVFPSYYEPWGYTPLEAGALGVASATTDLSGFGRFFCNECVQPEIPGIFVLKRLNRTEEQVVSDLTVMMENFVKYTKEERVANKVQARKVASMADWKIFIKNYIDAHNMAITRVFG